MGSNLTGIMGRLVQDILPHYKAKVLVTFQVHYLCLPLISIEILSAYPIFLIVINVYGVLYYWKNDLFYQTCWLQYQLFMPSHLDYDFLYWHLIRLIHLTCLSRLRIYLSGKMSQDLWRCVQIWDQFHDNLYGQFYLCESAKFYAKVQSSMG